MHAAACACTQEMSRVLPAQSKIALCNHNVSHAHFECVQTSAPCLDCRSDAGQTPSRTLQHARRSCPACPRELRSTCLLACSCDTHETYNKQASNCMGKGDAWQRASQRALSSMSLQLACKILQKSEREKTNTETEFHPKAISRQLQEHSARCHCNWACQSAHAWGPM